MISREELAADEKRKQDKALGALAGLAIGDAFGDAGRVPENHLTYGMMTDFAPGKTWSTDDTEFALFTAVMLIEHRGDPSLADFEEGWKKYIMSQDDFPRGGASEREAVSNLKKGLHAPQTGIYNAYAMSDGAAMRIAPVGIVCAGDPERAAQLAFRDAQVSHSGDGVWAAQAVAAGVSAARADGTDDEILEQALRVIPSDTWLRYSLEQTRELADKNHRDFFRCWMELHDLLRCEYKAASAEAVAAAFGILLLAKGNFRLGCFLGGNFGRDADTITAIVGAILGARGGAESIPGEWIQRTARPSGTCLQFTAKLTITETARRLGELIVV